MNFNSIQFLIFFPVVLIVHKFLPHRFRWVWLLVASYYFYMSWNAWLVFLIAGTTGVSYAAGLLIHKTENIRTKKLLLALTLVVCLGVLVFFKYFNFLMQTTISFLNMFSMHIDDFALNIILPIGISFYTFQTLSYVIDVYRGKFAPERHFGYYALFVSFFPQLVAGPIERPENLIPQLRQERNVSSADMEEGLRIMLMGFFKKIVIADFIGVFVNNAFANIQSANGLSLWLAVIFFTIQIYCDFSGYSDIATGCARMMGVKLMKNFDRPFSATSIREYGRRWHISLNSWFMDYLYFPLGGSRKGRLRKYLNIIIVFTLSGLWHGASWTFVTWGALIGLYTVLEDLLRPHYRKICKKLRINGNNEFLLMGRRIVLIMLISISSVFFRSQSMDDAGMVIVKLFTNLGVSASYFQSTLSALSMTIMDVIQLLLALAILCVGYYMCYSKQNHLFSGKAKTHSAEALRSSAYLYFIAVIALMWIIAVANNDVSAFLYFQF